MNFEQLKTNVGWHVNLHPIAVRLDDRDNEMEDTDYDWVIEEVTSDGIRISNLSTGHFAVLGKDHIHHFTSNPGRKGPAIGYGFLTLTVQLFLKGNEVIPRPTGRPGERTTIDGRPAEGQAARAHLLDGRLQAVLADYQRRGTPKRMIDTFDDLPLEEKAALYDKAVMFKKGRPPKANPYRSL